MSEDTRDEMQEGQTPEGEAPEKAALVSEGKATKAQVKQAVSDRMIRSDSPNFENLTRKLLGESKYYKIRIPSTETQKEDVFVSVNGVSFLIRRDSVVDVPKQILEALDHATQTLYTQVKRQGGEGMGLVPREVVRYPYQVVV